MAIARLSVKVGKAGKAAPHADYIAREGQYASRLGRGEVLEAKHAGNMPAWAADHPGRFWHAADAYERANGTTYRELELALPRELPPDDRAALVRDFVKQELGERHPYQWAIHRPQAADGQDQPHAHLMFSERRLDGIERDPSQFFRRYNAKAPEKGGAHKRFGEVDGPNRSQAQRNADLRALRGRWGEIVNDHLERAGVAERIDMRSLKAQGKDRAPEKKQLPSAWRDPQQRAVVLEYRQIHAERDQAAAAFRAVVPDGHVVDLEAHAAKLDAIRADIQTKAAANLAKLREARDQNTARLEAKQAAEAAAREQERAAWQAAWLADQPARDAAERERVAQVEARNRAERDRQSQEREARFDALRQAQAAKRAAMEQAPAAPDQAKAQAPAIKDPEQVYADLLQPILERHQAAAAASIEALRSDREQWTKARDAHQATKPGKVRLPGSLGKWERAGEALEQERRDFYPRDLTIERATPHAIKTAAREELRRAAPGVVERADAQRLAREAKELAERIAAAKRQKAESELKRDKANVAEDFREIANKREFGRIGYGDRSDLWKAMRPELKDKVEKYNALPKEQQPKELERIAKDPRTLEWLREHREQARTQGRGGRGD